MTVPSKFEGDDEEALAMIKANSPPLATEELEEFYVVDDVVIATGELYKPDQSV